MDSPCPHGLGELGARTHGVSCCRSAALFSVVAMVAPCQVPTAFRTSCPSLLRHRRARLLAGRADDEVVERVADRHVDDGAVEVRAGEVQASAKTPSRVEFLEPLRSSCPPCSGLRHVRKAGVDESFETSRRCRHRKSCTLHAIRPRQIRRSSRLWRVDRGQRPRDGGRRTDHQRRSSRWLLQ